MRTRSLFLKAGKCMYRTRQSVHQGVPPTAPASSVSVLTAGFRGCRAAAVLRFWSFSDSACSFSDSAGWFDFERRFQSDKLYQFSITHVRGFNSHERADQGQG